MASEALEPTQSLVGRYIEITGDYEVVEPGQPDQQAGLDAKGHRGHVLGWAPQDEVKYLVRTFSGLSLHVAPDALREIEVKPGEAGGFDAVWPDGDSLLQIFGQEVAAHIARKHFCVVQGFLSHEVRTDAPEIAKKLTGWKRLIKELEPAYLGRDPQGKVAWMPPDDPSRAVRTSLESCDRMLSKLASGLYLECQDTFGFIPDGRSDSLLRLPFRSRSEEDDILREREVLSEQKIKEGKIEDHIEFVQTRKICALFQVSGSARVSLHSKGGDDVKISLQSGQILIFRHDRLSFTYEPSKDSLALQAWLFATGFVADVRETAGNMGQEIDLAMGVVNGPLSPVNPLTGKTVSIKAIDAMLAGNGIGPEQFWAMLVGGTDGCRELSAQRWDCTHYFEPDKDMAFGKYYSNHGGFVMEEYLMGFDSVFFGFSEAQASLMDPLQRNSLEVGYTILHKAGWDRKRLSNANIGVYYGNCGTDWQGVKLTVDTWAHGTNAADFLTAANNHTTSTRLSYVFGLRGPINTSDTACSSSLVATGEAHNAIRPLNPDQSNVTNVSGKTEHALAIGTNALLGPFSWIGLCGPKMLSAKGRCFTFDYGADGFGRGEGTSGLFAEVTHKEPADRLAIFVGTCINQDGRSASMTAPHGPSQQECIKASLREADVTPADIRVAELHGTGTALGDPIEVGALRGVMKSRKLPILKTSAKSNLAHGEANAGMAGLVKCVLMLNHSTVPPNVHFHALNPHLDTNGYPVHISGELCELGTNSGYAGVSSFGFGGTNARADIWGKAHTGHLKVNKVDINKLQNVTVRCPKCLGQMEWKSACMMPSKPPQASPEGRSRARCVRGEFDSYEFCSLCYTGSYLFGQPPSEDPMPAATAYIKGSWTGFSNFDEMKVEDGAYKFQLRLGETRCERFYIALEQNDEYALFPSHSVGTMDVRVQGPCRFEEGHYFVIDGRDEEWPEGSLINIKSWVERRFNQRRISWELQPEEGGPKEMPTHRHSYQVIGSLTQMKMIPMKAARGLRNVFEYSTRLGLQSSETFQFVRDYDRSQVIYPARHLPRSGVPVRGPDPGGDGKLFAVQGRQGDRLLVRLEVSDGHVTVSASCQSSGTRTWHSTEGRQRRRFSVAGTWTDGCTVMVQDPSNPNRYTSRMTVVSHECAEEFQILVDEDPARAFFPEAQRSVSGGSMIMGPDAGASPNQFLVQGYPGTSFEICLDLASEHKWRTVTWSKVRADAIADAGLGCLEAPQ